jgi:hypothetical protein
VPTLKMLDVFLFAARTAQRTVFSLCRNHGNPDVTD